MDKASHIFEKLALSPKKLKWAEKARAKKIKKLRKQRAKQTKEYTKLNNNGKGAQAALFGWPWDPNRAKQIAITNKLNQTELDLIRGHDKLKRTKNLMKKAEYTFEKLALDQETYESVKAKRKAQATGINQQLWRNKATMDHYQKPGVPTSSSTLNRLRTDQAALFDQRDKVRRNNPRTDRMIALRKKQLKYGPAPGNRIDPSAVDKLKGKLKMPKGTIKHVAIGAAVAGLGALGFKALNNNKSIEQPLT
jgi:hypothetical protein